MVMFFNPREGAHYYPPEQIGQDDGQSDVEVRRVHEFVECDTCHIKYSDSDSINLVKKWLKEDGKAPCPIIDCPGKLEIRRG